MTDQIKEPILFVYSSYWRVWSRLLLRQKLGYSAVEIDLTPPDITKADQWQRVADVYIRQHRTAPQAQDRLVSELPDMVLNLMKQSIPDEALQRLLTEDFLPQIDWRAYKMYSNGGCAFERCKRIPRGREGAQP